MPTIVHRRVSNATRHLASLDPGTVSNAVQMLPSLMSGTIDCLLDVYIGFQMECKGTLRARAWPIAVKM